MGCRFWGDSVLVVSNKPPLWKWKKSREGSGYCSIGMRITIIVGNFVVSITMERGKAKFVPFYTMKREAVVWRVEPPQNTPRHLALEDVKEVGFFRRSDCSDEHCTRLISDEVYSSRRRRWTQRDTKLLTLAKLCLRVTSEVMSASGNVEYDLRLITVLVEDLFLVEEVSATVLQEPQI